MKPTKPGDPLTPRQRQVMDAIYRHFAKHGYPPSMRDLMPVLGITSNNGIRVNLQSLERKGFIAPLSIKARCIVPVDLCEAVKQLAKKMMKTK